jgi:hypothetical protein
VYLGNSKNLALSKDICEHPSSWWSFLIRICESFLSQGYVLLQSLCWLSWVCRNANTESVKSHETSYLPYRGTHYLTVIQKVFADQHRSPQHSIESLWQTYTQDRYPFTE